MISPTLRTKQKLNKEISSILKVWQQNENISDLLIIGMTFEAFLANKLAMIYLIRQGVPYSLFDSIQNYTPFTETDWAGILDLSTKSLQRYKQSAKQFGPLQSEKIIEMAEVTNIGLDVFGDMEKLKLWLDTPNFALGRLRPIELLKDSYGKEMVIGELTRINYGILA